MYSMCLKPDPETGEGYYIPADMTYKDWKQTFVDGGDKSGIMNTVEKESVVTNLGSSSNRYPATQAQLDDILENELKEFEYPVKPLYNARIKDNGRTIGEFYKWGQLKQIKSIDIGKQDSPERKFLIDTLLHEYYEAKIMSSQYSDEFFKK